MKTILNAILAAATAIGLLSTQSTSAASRFKNNDSVTIWAAYAYASESGFGCGYWDACDRGNETDYWGPDGWRKVGWWAIAPGGVVTVNNQVHRNAYHNVWADDGNGGYWGGGGHAFQVRDSGFNECGGDWEPVSYWLEFRDWFVGQRCCGVGCPSTSYQYDFNP